MKTIWILIITLVMAFSSACSRKVVLVYDNDHHDAHHGHYDYYYHDHN